MNVSAVIFDLDGTLTDSTRLFYSAVQYAMSKLGYALQEELFKDWHSSHGHWEELLKGHNADMSKWETLEQETFSYFDVLLGEDSQWMPGAERTIMTLKEKGMPLAIVTNSQDQFIDTMNKSLPIRLLFPIIITATFMKERRKPDPYGLLIAAERLNVTPSECLYIGDQRFDMAAANAAAMNSCLFIGPHTPADVELIAGRAVRALPEILDFIELT